MGLALDSISVSIKGDEILHDVSLEVKSGEFVSLLGKSGAGKSTTLKVIAGLLAQDRGHVTVGGRCVDDLPAYRRGVSIVFQDVRLFPNLSVMDNVAFPLRMQGVGRARRCERACALLRDVQLDGFGKRRCDELSGGQQQRVALARALAANPDVLLLDEPFSGLDEELRADMRKLVLELHRRLGTTMVQVTHDASEALMMSDAIVYLSAGRVVQTADPRGLYLHPATAEVAGCTGSCSTLSGAVARGRFEAGALSFPTDADEGPAVAVIRYDALHAADEGDFPVISSQYAGGFWSTCVEVAGQELTLLTARPHTPGERMGLSVQGHEAFVFPGKS